MIFRMNYTKIVPILVPSFLSLFAFLKKKDLNGSQDHRISQMRDRIYPYDHKSGHHCNTHHTVIPLKVVEGKFYWEYPDKPLHSEEYQPPFASDPWDPPRNHGTIAILSTGEVVASSKPQQHCTITNQMPVYFAGEYCAERGKITYLNPKSGHYRPDPEKSLVVAKKCFARMGVSLEKVDYDSKKLS